MGRLEPQKNMIASSPRRFGGNRITRLLLVFLIGAAGLWGAGCDQEPAAGLPPMPGPTADAAVSPDGGAVIPDGSVPGEPDAGPFDGGVLAPVPGGGGKSAPFYDEGQVVDVHVSFPPGAWEQLLTSVAVPANRWVPCGFSWNGESFPGAACRRKGNMTYWALEKKPQFLVRFNHTDKNGRFRGLRRLNFEFFDGTAAPIRDRVSMWLMRQSGVDASRANHARVWKDGMLLGLYQNIEVVDKEFLDDHFGAESGGNLWEEGDDLKTNEMLADDTRLSALITLIENEPEMADHTAFWAALDALVDISQLLREMAGETALVADDNFSNGAANFYFYEHPSRGFLVLPWDFDTALTNGAPTEDPFEFWGGGAPDKLRLLINANPAWKAEYVAYLKQIREGPLANLPAYVDAVCAQIRGPFSEDRNTNYTLAEFDADCALVKQRATERLAFLRASLGP